MAFPTSFATPCGCYYATTPEHSCTQMCSESGCTTSCRYGYPTLPQVAYPPPHAYSYGMYYPPGWVMPPGYTAGPPQQMTQQPPPQEPQQIPQPQPQPSFQQPANYYNPQRSYNNIHQNHRQHQQQSEQNSYIGDSNNSAASSEGTSEEQQHDTDRSEKTLREKLQGLLNRISSAKYDENYEKIRSLVGNEHEVSELTEAIYQQSVVQPKFVNVYADLCLDLCKTLSTKGCQSEKERFITCPFRRSLLQKCQHRFESVLAAGEEEKNDEKSILTFISSLHSKGIIGTKTIVSCLSSLLETAQRDMSENGTKSPIQLELVIHFFKAVHVSILSKAVAATELENILNTIEALQNKVSTRYKFLIMSLMETKEKFQKKQREQQLRSSAQES